MLGPVERASLRPVPRRPSGPVDAELATRHVLGVVPALDEPAARLLALVALAGRQRSEAAAEVEISVPEAGDALARARKALRRSMFPLPGSGWCGRAERLISDRLDDALEAPGPARLDVHLRNCARCVEHERRLVQATDAIASSFEEEHGKAQAPPAPEPSPAPALELVRTPPPRALPFGQPVRPAPGRELAPPPPAASAPAPAKPAVTPPPAALARAPEPRPESVPAQPAALAEERRRSLTLTGAVWGALIVLAVLLAVAAVALGVAGALGARL